MSEALLLRAYDEGGGVGLLGPLEEAEVWLLDEEADDAVDDDDEEEEAAPLALDPAEAGREEARAPPGPAGR